MYIRQLKENWNYTAENDAVRKRTLLHCWFEAEQA
jgi:hypothetical protein